MATTYTDSATQFYAGQARTNSAGAAVDDVTGEDLRLVSSLFTGGVVGTDAWLVSERGAGANMSVDVGSGTADADIAIVEGTALGQGNYVVRLEAGTVNVTVPAANVSNPRIDEVYLVVQDNAYDASSRVLPRIAYRDGTPAGSPSAPGPDAAWDAYLLLATISVPANDTTIADAQITDGRVVATSVVPTANVGAGIEFGGAVEQTIDSGLTSTYEDGASATFTKPADWNTYTIMAWGDVVFSGATAAIGKARASIGGNAGTEVTAIMTVDVPQPVSVRHERTGLTGDVAVVAQYGEQSGTVNKLRSIINFTAVRTS